MDNMSSYAFFSSQTIYIFNITSAMHVSCNNLDNFFFGLGTVRSPYLDPGPGTTNIAIAV